MLVLLHVAALVLGPDSAQDELTSLRSQVAQLDKRLRSMENAQQPQPEGRTAQTWANSMDEKASDSSGQQNKAMRRQGIRRTTHLRCATSRHEKRLLAITKALFASKILLPGSVVDGGAHKGGESCYYADLDPTRPVHAVEPLQRNVEVMHFKYSDRPNLLPLRGGLGSVDRTVDLAPPPSVYGGGGVRNSSMLINVFQAPTATNASSSSTTFHVYRLDDLFANQWAPERMAFGHFDVEGSELDVLAGANRTLQRDRPVFTVEVGGMRQATFNSKLMALLAALGYRPYLVDEQCGNNLDCRNLICFPLERLPPASLVVGTIALTSLSTLEAVYNLMPRKGRCGKAPRHRSAHRYLMEAITSKCNDTTALNQLVRRLHAPEVAITSTCNDTTALNQLVRRLVSKKRSPKHAVVQVTTPRYGGGASDYTCLTADSGSVALNASETTSWRRTKDACSNVCSRCARCRYFSFSRRWADCSWFAKCDWEALGNATAKPKRSIRGDTRTTDQRVYTTIFEAKQGELDTLWIK